MNNIRVFENHTPEFDDSVYIDDSAVLIGQVRLGMNSNIWPMAVLRGDINHIHVGENTNIQDGTIIHVTHQGDFSQGQPTIIGNEVTIGHQAMLHGCQIDDLVLVGMNAILLDGCHVPSEVMIGAGSLVPPGKQLESGYLYVGSPVKRVRKLTEKEQAFLRYSAQYYVKLQRRHRNS